MTFFLSLLLAAACCSAQTAYDYSRLQMDDLGRGVVAVRKSSSEVFVTWRYLSEDSRGTAFNIYRDGIKLNNEPVKDVTWFKDSGNPNSSAAVYEVRPVKKGKSGSFTLPQNAPLGYIPIKLEAPAPQTMPDGEVAVYSPNDCSIGDVDGDGEYEIFLKWDPSNSHDNAHSGYTGSVFIDCIKLNGERLWRVDLGRNIRAGAHYTQMMVYDLDGDGCAEMVVKTSDGTVDGTGKVIGNPDADYRDSSSERLTGKILSGNEYLTIFNGRTGAAMQTIDYLPGRGENGSWGDTHANRSDRHLAAIAYLDGVQPSVVMCRGYYTRATLAAYDWDGKDLKLRWLFDSHSKPELKGYDGQGNHNLRVADVDGDGRDEIIYGSCCIDHDGSGLYTTGYGHGDSMHLGAMIPGSDALQVWIGHETRGVGSTLTDARTGKLIYRIPSNTDVGRSMAADVDPTNPGWEMWSSASGSMRDFQGREIAEKPASQNFAVWWDGNLSRELLDGNQVLKFNPATRKVELLRSFDGAQSINGTKATPCISGDILGDWREEVILRSDDNSELRLYVSTEPTEYRFHSFMEDPVYRISVACENVCYNQPPETGFYFGADLSGEFRGSTIKGKGVKKSQVLEDVLLDSVIIKQQPRSARPQQGPQGQRPPQAMAQDNSYVDNTPDSLDLAKTARPVAGCSRKAGGPVLFLVGDSTMRTGTKGNGDNGQWGWGYYAHEFFDESRIVVENHALGGLSCRTFYRDWWADVIKGVQKGDYVIIQLGHNDSGPYDGPRGRSSIPGTGKETITIDNDKVPGGKEIIYSYGEYLRKYIDEVRAKEATPILFTLTPRNQWEENGSVRRKTDTFTAWIKEIAAEKDVPLVDLEAISAGKFEKFGKYKTGYMFYRDNIHSSAFGAMNNARSAAEGIAACTGSDLRSYLLPLAPEKQEFTRVKGRPVLFVTGDSTIQNNDSDPDGMWGWGSVLETVFDTTKITLVNAGKAGRSARTFLDEGRWDKVYNSIEPGDYVVIQFGHNDIGRINAKPFRAELRGTGDESENFFMPNKRMYQVIYTYGWYLRKFITDVREKGGIPILLDITPRNEWPDGKMERRNDTYTTWCKEVVAQTGVDFIDVHNISADFFDSIGPEATRAYYKNDHTHTSRLGAERNAKSFAEGLQKTGHTLVKYLKTK